jgi:sirohydrochlorin ferrochelatase
MTVFDGRVQRRPARIAGARARASDQRSAELFPAREFQRIAKFVAACRRQWPGAMIVLRPNEGSPPEGADAPPNPEPAPERT